MEKIKYSIANAFIMLIVTFAVTCIVVECCGDDNIGSKFDDDEFIKNLSNYE